MIVKGGRTHYGQAIGVITLDTKFPRIPGDVGNASSYHFPVKFKTVRGATIKRVLKGTDPSLLQPFIDAAKELEAEGVRAITTSCGFLAMYQEDIAKKLSIPLFSSSLMMVPLVQKMLGRGQIVGILTADSSSLSDRHLVGAGIDPDSPIIIAGLQEMEEFSKPMIRNEVSFDPIKVGEEMASVAKGLLEKNPNIGAFVFECANMSPYKYVVNQEIKLPVFCIIDFAYFIYNTVVVKDQFSYGFL